MSKQSLQDALGRWIRRQLEDGITVPEAVLDYLEATFGSRDLAAVLADEDAGEVDSLLDLLFYPDIGMQLKFEARWGRETFTDSDQGAIVVALCDPSPTAHITLPDSGSEMSLPVPDFACRSFVLRLNICRKIPEQLANIIDGPTIDDANLMIRVQLRNARLRWHDDQVALMRFFLTTMPSPAKTFESDLDFLISILPELAPGDEAYTFLTGKKFFYFKSLCSAEDFERKRMSSNMETMMMSGARSAHGNIDDWRQQMRRVDRICQALFGRTEFFQQPDSQYIDLQDSRNLQDVIQKLS